MQVRRRVVGGPGSRAAAAAKSIRLEVNADPALTDVTLDVARFRQVLYNYVSTRSSSRRTAVALSSARDGRNGMRRFAWR